MNTRDVGYLKSEAQFELDKMKQSIEVKKHKEFLYDDTLSGVLERNSAKERLSSMKTPYRHIEKLNSENELVSISKAHSNQVAKKFITKSEFVPIRDEKDYHPTRDTSIDKDNRHDYNFKDLYAKLDEIKELTTKSIHHNSKPTHQNSETTHQYNSKQMNQNSESIQQQKSKPIHRQNSKTIQGSSASIPRQNSKPIYMDSEPIYQNSESIHQNSKVNYQDSEPIYNDTVPVHDDSVPVHKDNPVHEDSIPIHKDSVPGQEDSVQVHEDSNPVHKDSVQVQEDSNQVNKDSVQVHEDSFPVHEDIKPIEKSKPHNAKGLLRQDNIAINNTLGSEDNINNDVNDIPFDESSKLDEYV
jgi:hypothetical protein